VRDTIDTTPQPLSPPRYTADNTLLCAACSRGLEKRGLLISEDDLGKAFAATDRDGDGTLDFKEWQSSGMATAVDAIAEYATPGSGVLTLNQARKKLRDVGVARKLTSHHTTLRYHGLTASLLQYTSRSHPSAAAAAHTRHCLLYMCMLSNIHTYIISGCYGMAMELEFGMQRRRSIVLSV
jgi:hypothetical protein